MSQNRVPILRRIAQDIRKGTVVDVYDMVADLHNEFPNVPETELERIVSEEVVLAHCNAVWDKRGH
jgi:hypothetical protein